MNLNIIHKLLDMATGGCDQLMRAYTPPRMSVSVMGLDLLIPAQPTESLACRADMVVLREGNQVVVLVGMSMARFEDSLQCWSIVPEMRELLRGTVFLACVHVAPGATEIRNVDIFGNGG